MEINEFILKAKINTYAGDGKEKILEDGSKELIYKENGLKYRDRYSGFNPFIDEELVWQDNKVVWAMNYYGRVISDIVPEKEIYQFLKESLKQIKKDKPFRGPDKFKQGDFEYINKSKGDLGNFKGTEKILYKGQKVHIVTYHGGIIKGK